MTYDGARIAGFDWDKGNSEKSRAKHGVEPNEAEQIFFNDPLLILDDLAHSGEESRFQALGKTDAGRLLFAAFALRSDGTLVRVISVRDMNIKERRLYAKEA